MLNIFQEYKVIIGFNDVTKESFPLYFSKNHVRMIGKSFNGHQDCFKFAANAVQVLSQQITFFCFSPLVRVDIMRMQSGKLVINELESLEGLFAHTKQRQPDAHYFSSESTRCFEAFLNRFWTSKMSQLIHRYLEIKW